MMSDKNGANLIAIEQVFKKSFLIKTYLPMKFLRMCKESTVLN